MKTGTLSRRRGWFTQAPPNARWNFFTMGIDMVWYSLGMGISSIYAILPLFVHRLTPANWVVALIPAIRTAAQLIPPIFIASTAERLDRTKPILLRLTVLERIPFFFLALAVVPLAFGHDLILLWIFFTMLAMQGMGSGLSFPPWLDLVARAIPDRLRGRFLGGWTGLGNATGIAGTALAVVILARFAWPWNFALTFGLTFLAMIISFILLALAREPLRPTHQAPRLSASAARRLRAWVGDLWSIVRGDPAFRGYLLANALSGLAALGSGLLAVAALNQAHLSETEVGIEGTILQVVLMIGFLGWGWIADRVGHKLILICGSFLGMVAMGAAAEAHGWLAMTLAFAAFGLGTAAMQLAQMSYVVEFGPAARRPIYIGLAYIGLAPFAAGAPLLGGILADRVGYAPVFALGAAFSFVAALAFWWLIRPPAATDEPAGTAA